MQEFYSSTLRDLRSTAEAMAESVLLPNAERTDSECSWPAENMRALAAARLTALTVPARLGGHGEGLLGVIAITEALAGGCASSAMCFGMHCVATAVLAAKATPYHDKTYLEPIAAGEHFTTLALSEGGTGSQFFLPQTTMIRHSESFVVNGKKQFVTNGSYADSYVVSAQTSTESEIGEFSCLVVDGNAGGVAWGDPWQGLGMRGNASRSMILNDVRVPVEHLLGQEGEQVWYVFEVVAPFFLTAMAGTYLGVAQTALHLAVQHVKSREFSHSGQSLSHVETVQHRIGELWMEVERTRVLVYNAARLGDLGSSDALKSLLASKAVAGNTAVHISNEAMTLCGGAAYRENSGLARLLRDARASHVMAPTTDTLKIWTGRLVLGLPLL